MQNWRWKRLRMNEKDKVKVWKWKWNRKLCWKKDKLVQFRNVEKNTFSRRRKRSPASSFTRGQITLAKLREVGAAVTGCRNVIIQFKLKSYGENYASFDRSVSFLRNSLYIIANVPSVDWSITIICISDLAWHRHHEQNIIIIDYTIDHCHHYFRQLSSCRQHLGEFRAA